MLSRGSWRNRKPASDNPLVYAWRVWATSRVFGGKGSTPATALLIILLIVTTLSAIPQRFHATSAAQAESIPGEFIVGFKKEFHIPDAGKQLAVSKGGNILKQLTHPALNAILVRVPLQQADAFQRAMKESPLVRYVEPNVIVSTTIVPNDPRYGDQWALPKIQAPQAWDINTGSSSVRVAVLDTGIDYTHDDIAPNYLPCGYDWVNSDTDPMDDHNDPGTGNSHGTNVAGTIAAHTNNGIGVAGVAGGWGTTHGATLIAEKVMDSTGRGDTFTLADAITHAVDVCNVDVINLSLGWYDFFSDTVQSALQYAADRGVISVAAAGNHGRENSSFYPCAYGSGHPLSTAEIVMCVSATDSSDNRASFSNYGNAVDVSAPGVNVLSTVRRGFGDYGYKSGTSMATPHVAAVVALVMSQFPSYIRDQIWNRVLAGTDDRGAAGWDAYYGWGRLNAHLALPLPMMTLSPTSGSAGTSVLVSGSNFDVQDTSCVISSSPSGLVANQQCVASGGTVSGVFTVASGATGSYTVAVTGYAIGDTAHATWPVVFALVRDIESGIYYGGSIAGIWSGSTRLPGWTPDSPAAVVCGPVLHVAVRGGDDGIYHGYVTLISGVFSGWSKLSGSTPSAPALAAAPDCTLYLAVRGSDNGIYLNIRVSGSWGEWQKLPGATIDAPAVAVAESVLHFVVRGGDGSSIWHGRMDRGTMQWLGWSQLPGSSPSKMALAAVSDTEVYLAVRGSDNRLYANKWDGANWTGWNQIPAGITPNGPSITITNGQLYLAVRGMDNGIYWCSRGLSTSPPAWSNWSRLPGATPSSPTIAS